MSIVYTVLRKYDFRQVGPTSPCKYPYNISCASTTPQECGFDGGDCCQCECGNVTDNLCGDSSFFCADPTSECVDPLVVEYPNCIGYLGSSGDGNCDWYNSNEARIDQDIDP